MTVRLDLNGLLAGASTPAGLTHDELTGLDAELAGARSALADRRAQGGLAFAELPHDLAHVRAVLETAEDICDHFDTMVVLGTGASAGGPRALVSALGNGDDSVIVSDAIDPAAVRGLLEDLDLERTIFNVVSKSGESAETMARFLIVRDRLLRELGAVDYKKHLIVTTGTQRGSLRQIVNDEGLRALDVPAEVASRFGMLSGIGLLPAAVAGIDVEEILAGARAMDERMASAPGALADPAFVLAGSLGLLARRGNRRRLLVMPFSERLGALASWFCRLWTETLATVPGVETRIIAAASADRHAHGRVLADGRRDATVLFVRVEDHGEALDIPAAYQDIEGIGCIGGNSLGTLLNAEQRATELALAREGGLSATLTLPALNPYTIGQVVLLLQMATVVNGILAGGDAVAPIFHDQRERLLQALLGRPGTEAQRADLEAWVAAKDPRFVV
jgi:glucose-6-phosphate isomerase